MTRSPEFFMKGALKIAQAALEKGELPIGAVVVLDDHIIASAHTTEVAEKRLLVHSELVSLIAADRLKPFPGRRRDVKLFTTLEPCLMCLGAAMSFGLGEIYYALEAPTDGAVEFARQWHETRGFPDLPGCRLPEIRGGILREQSRHLLEEYVVLHGSGPMVEWVQALLAALPDL